MGCWAQRVEVLSLALEIPVIAGRRSTKQTNIRRTEFEDSVIPKSAKHGLEPHHGSRRVVGQHRVGACQMLHLQRTVLPVINRRQHLRPQ
jgi:hypothetical protein